MRSNAAKRRPQLLSLPTDLLPSLGAFTSDVDAARIAISSKRARSTLTHAVWSAILRSNHGGLRIAAGDDGLRGKVGSDGFEKVLIGTRGARETLLQGRKGRAAKNSVLTSGA